MYAAVIVENRPLPYLDYVFESVKRLINWPIVHLREPVNNASDYNRLLTSKEFWDQLKGFQRVLIFQHDSLILRPGIQDFIRYDYVGAPWTFQEHGGNGGLSLRNPQTMLRLIQRYRYPGGYNEDVFFCNRLREARGNLAPRSVCCKFAVEAVYYDNPLGIHAPWKYLKEDQLKQVNGYDNIRKLQEKMRGQFRHK